MSPMSVFLQEQIDNFTNEDQRNANVIRLKKLRTFQ